MDLEFISSLKKMGQAIKLVAIQVTNYCCTLATCHLGWWYEVQEYRNFKLIWTVVINKILRKRCYDGYFLCVSYDWAKGYPDSG